MNTHQAKDIVISIFNNSSYRKTTETEKNHILDITKKFGDQFVQSCYVEAATKRTNPKIMNKIIVNIEKGKDMYLAYVSDGFENHAINGQGKTELDAINDFHVALEEVRENYMEDKEKIPQELIDLSFEYKREL